MATLPLNKKIIRSDFNSLTKIAQLRNRSGVLLELRFQFYVSFNCEKVVFNYFAVKLIAEERVLSRGNKKYCMIALRKL